MDRENIRPIAKHGGKKMRTKNRLNDAECAEYIGMSTSWLRRSRCEGNPVSPPFLKIGKSVRYDIADLDQWLRARRVDFGAAADAEAAHEMAAV